MTQDGIQIIAPALAGVLFLSWRWSDHLLCPALRHAQRLQQRLVRTAPRIRPEIRNPPLSTAGAGRRRAALRYSGFR